MTPYELKILLEIFVSPSWRDNCLHIRATEAWYEAIEKFKDLGLLENDQASDRLKVYLETVLELPLPTKKWVMP